ncbi:hypothetical protein PAXRUDRAFT_457738 [Paxillus rubicundulus Ve08.2h10]|uniref:Uncharacterized protein n=1 Tax=Paxillus rubicundulus Ve08.2h10 TaxID=930991 RepID=A0A0D0DQ39_9AGAM|nr:hypothetical protein PAXRUDRAFT_457738 [Paxillus rubicundulus Ve08.2h10]
MTYCLSPSCAHTMCTVFLHITYASCNRNAGLATTGESLILPCTRYCIIHCHDRYVWYSANYLTKHYIPDGLRPYQSYSRSIVPYSDSFQPKKIEVDLKSRPQRDKNRSFTKGYHPTHQANKSRI